MLKYVFVNIKTYLFQKEDRQMNYLKIMSMDGEVRVFENCSFLREARNEGLEIREKVGELGGQIGFNTISMPTNESLHELTRYIEELIAPPAPKFNVTVCGKVVAIIPKTPKVRDAWDVSVKQARSRNCTVTNKGFSFEEPFDGSMFLEWLSRNFLF